MPFDPGTPLKVEQVDSRSWRLLDDLKYHGKQETFVVPVGMLTDFASVPRLLTWLVPVSGRYTQAAVVHDFLCSSAIVTRNDADGIFRRALGELDVPTIRRYLMWAAVRLAARLEGAKPWDVIGIVSLTLLVLPVAAPIALGVFAVLTVLSVLEVIVWSILKLVGKSPPGPLQFWWA